MLTANSDSRDFQSQSAANSSVETGRHETQKGTGEQPAQSLIPPEIQELFGEPPLLIGEDPAHYNRLLEQWMIAIAPQNITEWLWLKDCVDESWEILRLPRFKSALISLGRGNAIYEIMREVIGRSLPQHKGQAERLASEWFTSPEAKNQVKEILSSLGLTEICIDAKALSTCATRYTKIDVLRGGAMARRNVALREIERRRAEIMQSAKQTGKVADETAEEVGAAPSDKPKASVKSE